MAQTYPVRSITTVAAPYPVSLDQFANSESGKINLSLIPTDASMQNYQVKLRLFIVGNGYKIYSDPNYASRSIMLNHGETQMFTGSELAAWFNPDNLIFEGISKSQYQKTGRLPEGMVQVWFETWDFYRNFNISGTSKAMVWLFENQPPTLTFPVDKKEFLYADPQNITFNWMPGQSPFSVAGLTNEYKFELWEIWPDNLTADAVVQTTQPIYTTTQTTTTLQYGTDCPILQTGRRYAWRIQAYDPEGKKQYKNNGYSVVRSFRYGRDCGIPEFKLDKVTTTKAILSWSTDTRYTAYNLRYRNKNKTNANWYEQTGTIVGGTIEKLQPATQYEIQLQATCYEQQGKWSNSIDLTTAQELSFNCGASASAVDLSDNTPLPTLLHNEYFKAYDFDIEVDEVSGANGRFSGTGYARVPLLNFVKFRVHFSGISINNSYRMTSGNVTFDYDESNGMSFDLSGVLSSIGVGATAESNPFTSIIPNQLSTGETQATNITFDNNTVVVRQSDGNTVTKTATSSTPFVAVTSTKPGSDSYVADASSGTVYKASSDPGAANGGSLQQPKASDKALSYAVSFAPHVRQLYGFDLPGEKHPEGNYKTQSIGGTDVLIPWKSVEAGQVDRVMATLGAKADTAIHFITQSGNMVMVAPGDKSNLQTPVSSANSSFKQLLIAGTEDNDQLRAWYTAPGDTTKKPERVLAAVANVVAYDKQTAPVYIVEVNGAVAPDASYIQTYLNSVYAPAIANFTVSKKAFTTSITSPFDNTVTDKMNYNDAQDALIKAFKDSVTIDKKALYLFFFKENTTHSDIKGHMPFNRQFGFIYAANQSITELTRTMAHELGHGAFRLKHIFSKENKFIQTEKQTDNLMDYASGSELLKYQWDECHDFDLGCNWFEDGDEAADVTSILVQKLVDYIKDNIGEKSVVYKASDFSFVSYTHLIKLEIYVPIKVSDKQLITIYVDFKQQQGLLDLTIDEKGISRNNIGLNIDLSDKFHTGFHIWFYSSTGVVLFELWTKSYDDFKKLLSYLGWIITPAKEELIIKQYTNAIESSGYDYDKLDVIFENIPSFVNTALTDDVKWKCLQSLASGKKDEEGTNEYQAIANILNGLSIDFLYDKIQKEPLFIRQLVADAPDDVLSNYFLALCKVGNNKWSNEELLLAGETYGYSFDIGSGNEECQISNFTSFDPVNDVVWESGATETVSNEEVNSFTIGRGYSLHNKTGELKDDNFYVGMRKYKLFSPVSIWISEDYKLTLPAFAAYEILSRKLYDEKKGFINLVLSVVLPEVNIPSYKTLNRVFKQSTFAKTGDELFKVDDLMVLKRADLPDFVRNNLDDLIKPENRNIIWELTEEANGQFTRGNLIEEIFNQWGSKYKNYQNLNEIIPNYKTLDFDGVLNNVNEVVSLKTYHPKLSTEKNLNSITSKIDSYASKLSSATLDANHAGKTRVLDFTIKKGEWDNFMPQIQDAVERIQDNIKGSKVIIRITEF
jgi:hypothetical protein